MCVIEPNHNSATDKQAFFYIFYNQIVSRFFIYSFSYLVMLLTITINRDLKI